MVWWKSVIVYVAEMSMYKFLLIMQIIQGREFKKKVSWKILVIIGSGDGFVPV